MGHDFAATIQLHRNLARMILFQHEQEMHMWSRTIQIADNTLVALTLMIAESRPDEKDDYAKTRNYWKYLKNKIKSNHSFSSLTTETQSREMCKKGIGYSYHNEQGE